MFGEMQWSKRRVAAGVGLVIVTLSILGVAGNKVYRHYTLPERIASGQMLFEHTWEPGDKLAGGGDGLGPVFNEKSCVACHFQGGTGGAGPNSKNVTAFEVVPIALRPDVVGGVVHASAITPDLQESFEQVFQLYPIVPEGVTIRGGCAIRVRDFNPVVPSVINTPALFGAGLIDELSRWSIHGDGLRRNVQGVSDNLGGDFSSIPVGRVRQLSMGRVGKFGWKGQFATLRDFVATACAVEVGLTNPHKSQMAPGEYREDSEAALDMTASQLDDLITYIASLPRPVEVLPDDPAQRDAARHGKTLFAEVGCADCHTPDLGGIEGIYSDFRLYNIAPEPGSAGYRVETVAVDFPDDHPKFAEWKTPPLWGVADSAPYLHDGSAATLHRAIQKHGGSAKKSRKRFEKLSGPDREALFAFLGTLRAPQHAR